MSQESPEDRSRAYSPVMVAVVVALLLLLAVAGLGSFRDLQAAQQRLESLLSRIEATRERNEELAQRIQRLQDDPEAIERLAREQYRMMKPGDVLLILPEVTEAVDGPSRLRIAETSSLPETE